MQDIPTYIHIGNKVISWHDNDCKSELEGAHTKKIAVLNLKISWLIGKESPLTIQSEILIYHH